MELIEQLSTEAEAMRFLRVSREAMLKFRRDSLDPIPHAKVGRRYLYDLRKVLAWAERRAVRERYPV